MSKKNKDISSISDDISKNKDGLKLLDKIIEEEIKHNSTTAKSKEIKNMRNVYPNEVEPRKMAVGIVFDDNGYVLLLQRYDKAHFKDKFKWVFPHDFIKENESQEDAVRRTIYEQVNAEVEIINKIGRKRHFYTKRQLYNPNQYRHIEMHAYLCRLKSKETKRIHHKRLHWKKVQYLIQYPWDEGMNRFVSNATMYRVDTY